MGTGNFCLNVGQVRACVLKTQKECSVMRNCFYRVICLCVVWCDFGGVCGYNCLSVANALNIFAGKLLIYKRKQICTEDTDRRNIIAENIWRWRSIQYTPRQRGGGSGASQPPKSRSGSTGDAQRAAEKRPPCELQYTAMRAIIPIKM